MKQKTTEKLSSAATRSLPYRFVFWSSHPSLVVWVLICLALLLFLFWRFLPDTEGNLNFSEVTTGLYCIIYGLTFWGIVVVVRTMAKFAVEDAIAHTVNHSAAEELRRIRSQTGNRISLDTVGGFIPDNPSKSLAMPRLFKHIIGEAQDRKFESSVVLMQPYREESMGEIIDASIVQKTTLQLGILGTFIGLIGAFTSLDFAGELDRSLKVISGSLQFSFSTSIAGLVSSILLGVLLVLLRKKQESYFQNMEESTGNLIALVRNADNKDYFLAEFQQINTSVNLLEKRITQQTQKVSAQTDEIRNGLKELGTARSQFDQFLGNVSKAEEKFLKEMKDYHSILSPEEISTSLRKSLDKAVGGLSASLNENLIKSIRRYGDLEKSTSSLNSNIVQLEKLTREHLDRQKQTLEASGEIVSNASTDYQKALEKTSQSQEEFIKKITGAHVSQELKKQIVEASKGITDNLHKEVDSLRNFIRQLNSELEVFNTRNREYLSRRLKFEKLRFKIISIVGLGFTGIAIIAISSPLRFANFFRQIFNIFAGV